MNILLVLANTNTKTNICHTLTIPIQDFYIIVYKLVHLNISWLTSVWVDEMIGYVKMSNRTSSKLRTVES